MEPPPVIRAHKNIILFDGVCNLCNGFLRFVYKRDLQDLFKFAWIQDDNAADILYWLDQPTDTYETILLIENGKAYYKSDAVLKIVSKLKFPWPFLRIGYLLPRFIRDRIYDWVAKNRYKWFGRKPECMVPTGDLKTHFLSPNYTN